MTTLPTLSTAEAIRTRTARYNAIRPCKACGSHERFMARWSNGGVACVGCEGITEGSSLGKVNSAIGNHNRKVKKTSRQNWGIPVVFSGMNTCTR